MSLVAQDGGALPSTGKTLPFGGEVQNSFILLPITDVLNHSKLGKFALTDMLDIPVFCFSDSSFFFTQV